MSFTSLSGDLEGMKAGIFAAKGGGLFASSISNVLQRPDGDFHPFPPAVTGIEDAASLKVELPMRICLIFDFTELCLIFLDGTPQPPSQGPGRWIIDHIDGIHTRH